MFSKRPGTSPWSQVSLLAVLRPRRRQVCWTLDSEKKKKKTSIRSHSQPPILPGAVYHRPTAMASVIFFATTALVSAFCVSGVITGAPIPRTDTCKEFYFYDHGTDHCEHCSDICDDADVKGTMDQCWEQCQSYALSLWPPKPANPFLALPKQKNTTPSPSQSDGQSSGSTSFPLAAKVIIPLAFLAALAGMAMTLVLIRRRRIMNNPRPPTTHRSSPRPQNVGQTATLDQTAQLLLDPVGEHDSALDSSARATCEEETSLRTVGIQEEGQAGDGEREVNQTGGREPIWTQATPSHQENLPHSQAVMVSAEGNNASSAMALPQSPKMPHGPATSQWPDSSLSVLDLDSTELKTLIPSSDEGSLDAGRGETGFTACAAASSQ